MLYRSKLKMHARSFFKDGLSKLYAMLFFAFAGFCLWLLAQLLFEFYSFDLLQYIMSIPYVETTFTHFTHNIKNHTSLGVFYIFAFSSLFSCLCLWRSYT